LGDWQDEVIDVGCSIAHSEDMARDDSPVIISPDEVLKAYTLGYFPMARTHEDLHAMWVLPEERGAMWLKDAHVPRKLKRFVSKDPFVVTANENFSAVIKACAELGKGPTRQVRDERNETWINEAIEGVYNELHDLGFAHSIECWALKEGGDYQLLGGLYGLAMGGVFFGESMFSRQQNASKVAFVHLLGRLKIGGFTLLDTQFYTDHLGQFGVEEISNECYQERLEKCLVRPAALPMGVSVSKERLRHFGGDYSWDVGSMDVSTSCVLQSITQTS